jgi:hypothetical protein
MEMEMEYRAAESLEDFHQRGLDWLEVMFCGGSAIAIPAGVQYCAKHDLDVPRWLAKATATHYAELLRGDVPQKRGRSGNLIDRYRQDMNDYMRWDEVTTVRKMQIEVREELNFLNANPGKAPAGRIQDREKMHRWVGRSLERAFECASMLLAETPGFGGPDAMRLSYWKVEKAGRIQGQALRYHMLDSDFLLSIGISQISHRTSRIRKVAPLYDLTR